MEARSQTQRPDRTGHYWVRLSDKAPSGWDPGGLTLVYADVDTCKWVMLMGCDELQDFDVVAVWYLPAVEPPPGESVGSPSTVPEEPERAEEIDGDRFRSLITTGPEESGIDSDRFRTLEIEP